ncbi:cyclase family protein [Microbacterium sp. A93]|uniref:cyclase family protein n=1 Tax=Microbacterium sp. A93 TaxID=3450716 RepID=UPI003F42E405
MPTSSNHPWKDLTRPISTGMPVVPGDPAVEIGTALTLEHDGAWVSHLCLGSHTGTHVDAPAHLVPGGRTVDRLELAELCGPAVILGLEGLGPHAPITADRLRPLIGRFGPAGPDGPATPAATLPPRVLVHTGAAELHPAHLTEDAARLLWDAGARLLGIDTASPDSAAATGLPVHRVFLGHDGILVENLTGLDCFRPPGTAQDPDRGADWTATITVGVYPLPLAGRDGAPARAVARHRGPDERTPPC